VCQRADQTGRAQEPKRLQACAAGMEQWQGGARLTAPHTTTTATATATAGCWVVCSELRANLPPRGRVQDVPEPAAEASQRQADAGDRKEWHPRIYRAVCGCVPRPAGAQPGRGRVPEPKAPRYTSVFASARLLTRIRKGLCFLHPRMAKQQGGAARAVAAAVRAASPRSMQNANRRRRMSSS